MGNDRSDSSNLRQCGPISLLTSGHRHHHTGHTTVVVGNLATSDMTKWELAVKDERVSVQKYTATGPQKRRLIQLANIAIHAVECNQPTSTLSTAAEHKGCDVAASDRLSTLHRARRALPYTPQEVLTSFSSLALLHPMLPTAVFSLVVAAGTQTQCLPPDQQTLQAVVAAAVPAVCQH